MSRILLRHGVSAVWAVVFALVAFSVGMTSSAISSLLDARGAASEAEELRERMKECSAASSTATAAVAPTAPATTTATTTVIPVDPVLVTQSFPGGIPLPADIRLSHQDADNQVQFVTTAEALGSGSVSILNLWAPSCGPCVREMPLLRKVVDAAPRGVQFVPVLVGDEEARPSKQAARTPRFKWFLSDFQPTGGLVKTLSRLGLYREEKGLPVTFVVDCRRTVRWVHFGELTPEDAPSLEEAVEAVAAELSTGKCAPAEDDDLRHRPKTPRPIPLKE